MLEGSSLGLGSPQYLLAFAVVSRPDPAPGMNFGRKDFPAVDPEMLPGTAVHVESSGKSVLVVVALKS